MRRNIFYTFLGLIFLTPYLASALTLSSGIPARALWFSKDPFFEGESITIYTLLYNSSPYKLSGTLTLYDGSSTIASKLFILSGDGASSIVAFPWKVTKGTHTFSAAITSKEFSTNTHIEADTSVLTPKTGEVKRFADLDTDGDGTGNKLDSDDDGDGVTDLAEGKLGTNPLASDTDGDGIHDNADAHPLVKDAPIAKPSPTPSSVAPASLPKAITDELPTTVVDATVPVVGALESYRVNAYQRSARTLEDTIGGIVSGQASSSQGSSGWEIFREGAFSKEVTNSPFQYTKLFFVLLWQAILAHPLAFYILIFFILGAITRFIWGLFF